MLRSNLSESVARTYSLRRARSWKLAFLIAFFGLVVIAAQTSCIAQTRSLRAMLRQPPVADAIADTYGRAVVADFAKLISEQGDSDCRRARSLNATALNRGAEAVLVSYGIKLAELQSGRVTEDALGLKLDDLAGPGSAAALRELADESRIKDLQRFFRAKFNDNLVDRTAEALDRYAIIHRLFRGHVSPLSRNIALATTAAERAVDAENAAKKAFGDDAKLHRLIELYSSLIDAYEFELIRSASLTSADYEVFGGVEKQLQGLCLRLGA